MPDTGGLPGHALQSWGRLFCNSATPAESPAQPRGHLHRELLPRSSRAPAAHSSAPAGNWGAGPALSEPQPSCSGVHPKQDWAHREEPTQSLGTPSAKPSSKAEDATLMEPPAASCYLDKARYDLSHLCTAHTAALPHRHTGRLLTAPLSKSQGFKNTKNHFRDQISNFQN